MKKFYVYYTYADTCGSVWRNNNKPTKYYESESIKDVIHKENIEVSSYTLNTSGVSVKVDKYRTPVGKGYGHWEINPDFNFEKDLPNISEVTGGAFARTHICEISFEVL